MSSLTSIHELSRRRIEEHDRTKPFAPENGKPLAFKAGDKVIFTNDYGVPFRLTVTGFYQPGETDALYASGYRYMLDSDCYWMPVKERNLQTDRGQPLVWLDGSLIVDNPRES